MKLYALLLAAMLPGLAAAPGMIKGNAFGNPKAPIRIDVFSDFQCPACKTFHDTEVPQLMKDYVTSGKAYLVFRYFPLPMHKYGRKAAELVCACAQFDKYEAASNLLFAQQTQWAQDGKVEETLATLLSPAEQKKLPALVQDQSVQGPVDHDLAEGAALGVSGTPTLMVTYKSKRQPLTGQGVLNYTFVKAYLDDILKN